MLYFADVIHSTKKQHAYLRFIERIPNTCTLFFFSIADDIQTPINHLKQCFCLCCSEI